MKGKRFAAVFLLAMAVSFAALLSGCGGGGSVSSNDQAAVSANKTIIPESVRVEKNGDAATISYQTSAPAKDSKVVTADFGFNGAPMWSDFHDTTSSDGLTHRAVIDKVGQDTSFMLFNSAQDKYDNGGKGIKIQ